MTSSWTKRPRKTPSVLTRVIDVVDLSLEAQSQPTTELHAPRVQVVKQFTEGIEDLNRRLADEWTLTMELLAWENARNRQAAIIHWRFSVDDARRVFRHHYQAFSSC
ncbi:MAG: hypothetical protein HC826_00960 [Rhodospirillales bacterium]|nr:hypothetical protein [Rhodospirillales bacterium]